MSHGCKATGNTPVALGSQDVRWRQSRIAPLYEISDRGEVRCDEGPRKAHIDRTGRPSISLQLGDGAKKKVWVETLVAHAFLGTAPEGMELRHVDGDKTNVALSNLRYVAVAK